VRGSLGCEDGALGWLALGCCSLRPVTGTLNRITDICLRDNPPDCCTDRAAAPIAANSRAPTWVAVASIATCSAPAPVDEIRRCRSRTPALDRRRAAQDRQANKRPQKDFVDRFTPINRNFRESPKLKCQA